MGERERSESPEGAAEAMRECAGNQEGASEPSPLRAHGPAHVLTYGLSQRAVRSEGSVAPSSETPPRPFSPYGRSGKRLAISLRRRLLAGALACGRACGYSVSLTLSSGNEADVRAGAATYAALLMGKTAGAGAVLVLDRSPTTGRWHIHGLVILPSALGDASKRLVTWWMRSSMSAATCAVRPARRAQKVRRIKSGAGAAGDLYRTLTHHLDRERAGDHELPALGDRAYVVGSLLRVWKLSGAPDVPAIAIPVVKPAPPPQGVRKGSSFPLQPHRRAVPGTSCAWCGAELEKGKRVDARYCDRCCKQSASRARIDFSGAHGPEAMSAVDALIAKGWTVQEALQSARRRFAVSGTLDRTLVKLHPYACRCGKPLARRIDAKTCGSSTCRSRAKRSKPAKSAGKVIALLRTCGKMPFALGSIRKLSDRLGVMPERVVKVLRRLAAAGKVKECVGPAGPEFAFTPAGLAVRRAWQSRSLGSVIVGR